MLKIDQKFNLSPLFLMDFYNTQPNWGYGELSYFTYKRTYARELPDGSLEEYWQTVQRVVEGCYSIQKSYCIKNNIPWDDNKAQRSAQEMYRRIWDFKFTPPGRGFWVMGTEVIEKIGNAALMNCAFTSTLQQPEDSDRVYNYGYAYAWATDMLMLGVGIGYDTFGRFDVLEPDNTKVPSFYCSDDVIVTNTLPDELDPTKSYFYTGGKTPDFILSDKREAWANAVGIVVDAFAHGTALPNFDYVRLRPAGAKIKTFGGTASGPEPLMRTINQMIELLRSLVGKKASAVTITDMMNMIARCVVAGNTRRSAQIALALPTDADFIEMKDYNKYPNEVLSHRWASNNSVVILNDQKPFKLDNNTIRNILLNGEPGIINLDRSSKYLRNKDKKLNRRSRRYHKVKGYNPCAEQPLDDKEMCNLVETYPFNHVDLIDFLETLKYAYLYAKTVTLLDCHNPDSDRIMKKFRRIGVGQTGIQQAREKFGDVQYFEYFCDMGYEQICKWDKVYSNWFKIEESIRKTTVKPSGTVSLLAGATPGVHYAHAPYYFRTVRVASNNPIVRDLVKANFRLEISITDRPERFGVDHTADLTLNQEVLEKVLALKEPTTLVVYFPIEEKGFSKSKFDVTLEDQLESLTLMQYWWSDNAVSCTVTISNDDIGLKPGKQIKDKNCEIFKKKFKPYYPLCKTVSFLPLSTDSYQQAPYTTVTKEQYETYASRLKSLDLTNQVHLEENEYCGSGKCELPTQPVEQK